MKRITENLIILAATVVAFVAGAFMVLKAPQYHSDYIRGKTAISVALLHDAQDNARGSGFAIRYKGMQLVISNDHVCEVLDDRVRADINGKSVILGKTNFLSSVDLCILSVASKSVNLQGLKLASSWRLGQEVMVVGHPAVMPFTLNRGQIISLAESLTLRYPIFNPIDYLNCIKHPGTEAIQHLGMTLCISKAMSLYTTVLGLPGNSGSALIDFWGDVVGVVYAGNRANWLIAVPLEDLVSVLDAYQSSLQ